MAEDQDRTAEQVVNESAEDLEAIKSDLFMWFSNISELQGLVSANRRALEEFQVISDSAMGELAPNSRILMHIGLLVCEGWTASLAVELEK